MTETTARIPFIDTVRVRNHPLPLWHAHWRGLVNTAFGIRQETAIPIGKGGLDFHLTQYENTRTGVETLRGQVMAKDFLKDKKAGVEAWINRLCYVINQCIRGYKPIEQVRIVMLKDGYLAYYGSFYSEQMEIIIYIGSRDDIDGATVFHRRRSEVDLKTRDLELLTEFLPETIWIKEEA